MMTYPTEGCGYTMPSHTLSQCILTISECRGRYYTRCWWGTCFSGRVGNLLKVTKLGKLGLELGFPDSKSRVLFTTAKSEPCYSVRAPLPSCINWELVRNPELRVPPRAEAESVFSHGVQVTGLLESLRAIRLLLSMTARLEAKSKQEKQNAIMWTSQK